MSQISLPIRILLVGAVLFLAAWFTVLKPSDEVVPAAAPVTSAPVSTAGKFKAKAEAGKATAEADATGAANASTEDTSTPAAGTAAATTGTDTAIKTSPRSTTAPATPALPAEAVAKLPRAVRAGLQQRKVVVLGVLDTASTPYATASDDDRLVRRALRGVNRYDGKVVVEPVSIGRLVRYDGIPEALGVTQSPTVVVIDRNRRATSLTGYQDRDSINQAIADARRSSTKTLIGDPYLAKVNRVCGTYDVQTSRFSLPTSGGARGRWAAGLRALSARERRSVQRIAAPARWRALKAQILSANAKDAATAQAILARGASTARAIDAVASLRTVATALDRRYNAVGLTSCASRRTR